MPGNVRTTFRAWSQVDSWAKIKDLIYKLLSCETSFITFASFAELINEVFMPSMINNS